MEDLRKQIFQIFGQIAPDEKNKLGFLVDTIHQVGSPRDDRSPRPVIIQFTMRTFRQKIWKTSYLWWGRKSFDLWRIWHMEKDNVGRNFGHLSRKPAKMEKRLPGMVQMWSSKGRESSMTQWKMLFETPLGLSLSLQFHTWMFSFFFLPVQKEKNIGYKPLVGLLDEFVT